MLFLLSSFRCLWEYFSFNFFFFFWWLWWREWRGHIFSWLPWFCFSSYFILYVFVQIFCLFWYDVYDLFFLPKYKSKSSFLLSEYFIFWHHLSNLRIWRRKMCNTNLYKKFDDLPTSLPCEVSQKSVPAFSLMVLEGWTLIIQY